MANEITVARTIPRSIHECVAVFTADPRDWLPLSRTNNGTARWLLHLRAGQREFTVDCTIGAPAAGPAGATRAMAWRLPLRRGLAWTESIAPRFRGHLVLTAASPDAATLRMSGSFAGAAVRGLGAVALSAAGSFMDDTAARLDEAPRRTRRSNHSLPSGESSRIPPVSDASVGS